MAPQEEQRLSLSRDALRADLAEMELRLRTWIGERLSEKADAAALKEFKADSEARFRALEKANDVNGGVSKFKQYAIPLVLTIILNIATWYILIKTAAIHKVP